MVTITILIAALAGLAAASIAVWSWHQIAQIHQRVGNFGAFEGMHFER